MKMKRTKSPYPHYYNAYGGHLAFPPADCPCLNYAFKDRESGVVWLDICFCAHNKCNKAPCERRKHYSDEWHAESERLSQIRKQMRGG